MKEVKITRNVELSTSMTEADAKQLLVELTELIERAPKETQLDQSIIFTELLKRALDKQ